MMFQQQFQQQIWETCEKWPYWRWDEILFDLSDKLLDGNCQAYIEKLQAEFRADIECSDCGESYSDKPDQWGDLACPNCGRVIITGLDPGGRHGFEDWPGF